MAAQSSIMRGRTASELAASVERAVREGLLAAGAALPTVRALADELRLSPATVAAAYRALRARGLVSTQGRRGTRVTHRPPVAVPAPPPVAAGLRNLADGNPDPGLLPRLRPLLLRLPEHVLLYDAPAHDPRLRALAARQFAADGIDAGALTVVAGALDGVERVLQAHLRPGDRVAVEDPGYSGVLDLVAALGLLAEPVAVDDAGPEPGALQRAVRAGCRALVLTPRAQNPTGAALDPGRARELRRVLQRAEGLLVVEDDHAGPISGAPAVSLVEGRRTWAVVRSVSKSLGPDLRLAVVAGDPHTVARVEGRQALGHGWVSHLSQRLVAALWSDRAVQARLRAATQAYAARRHALLDALARHGVEAHGRSGLNVWVPVGEEVATIARLAAAGWAVRAGERYRVKSAPAIRITVATLREDEVERLASDVAAAVHPAAARVRSA
jgi:DNA-binding transcriptional MocR family regulator